MGHFCGLCTRFGAMCTAETSPTVGPGALGTANQMGIVMGILEAQIFGLKVILGTEDLWGAVGLPHPPSSLLQRAALLCHTESPWFLPIRQKEEDSSKEILLRVWGTQDVTQAI